MVFFLESVVLGNWIPRIPDVKSQLSLSGFALGVCLLVLSAGTMLSLLLSGKVTARFGLRSTLLFSLPLWALFFVLPGWVTTIWQLMFALFLAGTMIGLTEVAMNTMADRIEKYYRHRIMSRCHGFWSLGSLVGAATGAAFSHLEVATGWHFLAVMPLTAVIGLWFCLRLPRDDLEESVSAEEEQFASAASQLSAIDVGPTGNRSKQTGNRLTNTFTLLQERGLLLLCIMPLGIMCVEGVFIDWSALFVREVLQADALAIGLVYAFFSLVMAGTRMLGDGLTERFGPVMVAKVSAVAATVGIVMFAFSVSVPMAFVAAGLAGLGVAIVYPLAMTAAAERPGPAAENVSMVALIGFSAFLLAPPITGFVSDWLGLRWALVMFAPLAALSGFFAGELVSGTGTAERVVIKQGG